MITIFLDIDGVLATEYCSGLKNHELYSYPWDKECVDIFNHITSQFECNIVLSSEWRIMYNNDLEMLDELFKHNGVTKSPNDVTPNLHRKRGLEIETYVKEHELTNFIILDDEELNIYPDQHIECSLENGIKQLQQEIIARCKSLTEA